MGLTYVCIVYIIYFFIFVLLWTCCHVGFKCVYNEYICGKPKFSKINVLYLFLFS